MTNLRSKGPVSSTTSMHEGQPVFTAGRHLSAADAVVVMLHGRGATAQGILLLADEIGNADVAYLAPQARGLTWYPNSFLTPITENEPALSSALRAVSDVVVQVENAGLPTDRLVLLGFSQGACLALEFAARHAKRYGGVIALSGGLIGTKDRPGVQPPFDKLFEYDGSLAGTPVFIGCSDVDPHIPLARVRSSAAKLREMGAAVTERIYEGMGHSVNEDEFEFMRRMISSLLQTGSGSIS